MNGLPKNIVISFDDNYILPARVMLSTLAKYCDNISLYLVYSSVCEENIRKLEQDAELYHWKFCACKVDDQIEAMIEKVPAWKVFSKAMYYRLFLPWIMKDCDRALYIDVDTMIRANLDELYQKKADNCYVIAVPDMDPGMRRDGKQRMKLGENEYFNSGVQLIFLEKIRQDFRMSDILAHTQQILTSYEIVFPDQDVLNVLYQGHIYPAERYWNYGASNSPKYKMTHRSELKKAKIVHFTSHRKPWKKDYCLFYINEYYQYLKPFLTPKERRAYWMAKPMGVAKLIINRR